MAALKGLTRLKSIDIRSSSDTESPFMLTIPRVIELLRAWPRKEEITISGLVDAARGPPDEDDEMWEREYMESSDWDDDEDQDDEDDEEDSEEDSDANGDGLDNDNGSVISIGKTRTGIKALTLTNFDIDSDELALILKHVSSSLLSLCP